MPLTVRSTVFGAAGASRYQSSSGLEGSADSPASTMDESVRTWAWSGRSFGSCSVRWTGPAATGLASGRSFWSRAHPAMSTQTAIGRQPFIALLRFVSAMEWVANFPPTPRFCPSAPHWNAPAHPVHHAPSMNHLSCIFLILSPTLVGAAPQIGYAQATGYYKQDTQPMVYQPAHLLDGRESTSWCSTGPDAFEETLMFGFKGVTTIDEIRIYTGNGFDDSKFHGFGPAKKLAIRADHG